MILFTLRGVSFVHNIIHPGPSQLGGSHSMTYRICDSSNERDKDGGFRLIVRRAP